MEHHHSCLLRLVSGLLAFCTALPLTACGQKQPEPRPGVTYTSLISDMNRQILSGLDQAVPDIQWWGVNGRHIVAYGADEKRQPLLVDVDPQEETYTTVPLTLPPLAEDLPELATALAAEEDAFAAGTTPSRDIAQGYNVPSRRAAAVLETEDRQLYLLLEDRLLRYGQAENGSITIQAVERALTLCNLDRTGTLQPVAQLQLPDEYRHLLSVADDCFIAPDGTLWLSASDFSTWQAVLLQFSMADGSLLSTLTLPEGVTFDADDVTLLPDGRLLVLTQQTDAETGNQLVDSNQLYICDDITQKTPSWNAPLDAPAQLFDQGTSGSFVPQLRSAVSEAANGPLISTTEGIFLWDLTTNEVTQQLQWTEFAVQQQDLWMAVALPKGQYFVVTLPAGVPCIQVLTPLSPEALADRTVLTFGELYYGFGLGENPIEPIIARFNATSTDYYIKIVNYEKLAEQKGYGKNIGYQALQEAVLDGDVPDILMLGVGAEDLLSKQLTIDLYPYLDADPELSREDLLPNMLAATERDGALASMLAAYSLDTVAADSRVVGDQESWTWQECQDVCAAAGNHTPIYHSYDAVYQAEILNQSGNLFVDWENRIAHFDTQAGVEFLQNTAFYPKEQSMDFSDPKEDFNNGTWLLRPTTLYSWDDMLNGVYVFGDNCRYVGFPTDGSTNGSLIRSELQLGISRYCEHPDAAWQLLRMFLLPSFQDTLGQNYMMLGFPVRRDSLERSAAVALERYAEGTWAGDAGAIRWDDNLTAAQKDKYKIYVTQADIDKVLRLIENTTELFVSRGNVYSIVYEETQAFLNGVRTAEEAVKIIQDRVQTYLDELK